MEVRKMKRSPMSIENFRRLRDGDASCETIAREILERMGIEGPFTNGDIVEISNLVSYTFTMMKIVGRIKDELEGM
jgi:hypothetical protein